MLYERGTTCKCIISKEGISKIFEDKFDEISGQLCNEIFLLFSLILRVKVIETDINCIFFKHMTINIKIPGGYEDGEASIN